MQWRLVALRVAVVVLGLYVGAYLLGLLALALLVLAKHNGTPEAWAWWRAVALEPAVVFTLIRTERQVQTYLLSMAGLLASLAIWGALEIKTKATRPQVASRYGSHGTGRWAEPEEILAAFPDQGPGAVLGRLKQKGRWRPVIFPWASRTRNRFVLIVGPPGSGKTSRYSLPNLVHAAQVDTHRSLLITDPKGELHLNMAEFLQERGWEIRTVNLLHPQASDRYNPMDYVRTVEDAFRLANTIIANTSGTQVAGDAFWTNAERSLLACLIWYARTCLEPQYQHMAAVLHLGNRFARDPELMASVFEAPGVDPTAQRLYGQIASLSDKTRDGVFIGFAVRLQLWASPEIAALTAASDFDLRDLGRRPVALFVIIPDHHSTYQALTSLFFDQAFQELITEADENGGRLQHEVRLMLEEMANIGRIPDLEKRLATIRSRGLLVEMILQTMGQLKAGYGEAWNTITGCADTILALAANDQETAEWLSKRLGTATIKTTSTSSTATEKGSSSSESHHYTSRALMLPDEVQGQGEEGLGQDELLLIQRGMPPARLSKYPIDEVPGAAGRKLRHPKAHRVARRPEDPAPLPEVGRKDDDEGESRPAWLA
ncbi:MAG: VirD4-like conjugal transfer protein, CD1115 family [Bacillota bacterium]